MPEIKVTPAEALGMGWSIIPANRNKQPMLDSWKPYQSRHASEAELQTWLTWNPPAWAIITGRISHRFSLDFDGEKGRQTLAHLQIPPHRSTPSGGYHVDFIHPGVGRVATVSGKTKIELGKRWPGVDVRGDGGYVLYAGETDRGKYSWLRDPQPHPLETLPDDLREFLRPSPPSAQKLIQMALERIPTHGRNASGFWLATQLRDNQYSEEKAKGVLQDYRSRCPEFNAKGQPEEYAESEVLATLKQAYRGTPRDPWEDGAPPSEQPPSKQPPFDQAPQPQKHFIVKKDGVYRKNEEDSSEIFVCSPLEVDAYARDPNSESWGRLLKWHDVDGNEHSWVVPMRMLVGDGLPFRETLADGGVEIGIGSHINHLLAQYVRSQRPKRRIFCVPHVGWLKRCFVFPESVIPPGSDVGYQSMGRGEHYYRTSGTLPQWRENIARKCIGNSRLIFAVSAAFAGPLMRPLNVQGGGFHFRSDTSMGKSTTQWVAGSVWGGGGRLGFARTWSATKNALESIAELHNDGFLMLDEIQLVEPGDVEQMVYMLANGSGKARENRNMTGRRTLQWLLMILSNGEIQLSDCAALAGKKIRGGAEIRMATIPADAGAGMGIFERLHGTGDPRVFAECLESAARLYYGTAIRAFIKSFVAHWDDAIRECLAFVEDFIKDNLPSGAAPEVRRVLRRFALAAGAGEMATEIGITGWQPKDATQAAMTCFLAWIEERGGVKGTDRRNAIEQVRAFVASQHDRFRSADPKEIFSNGERIERVPNSAGYHKEIDGEPVYLIHTHVFEKEVCRGFSYLDTAKELHKEGWLQINESGRLTFKAEITLPGGAKERPRFYAVKAKILKAPEE